MANEKKIWQFTREAGYDPLEGRCIVVSEILSVTLADELLDTIITIQTNNDEIRLATQQKALSDWRMSGFNATQFAGGYKNWHKENIDETLKALTRLGGEAGN